MNKKLIILLLSTGGGAGGGLSSFILNANGANWRLNPSLELTETYTDNVSLDVSKRQGDYVTQVTPGVQITGEGARLNVLISYHPIYLYYPGNKKSKHDFRQNLQASITSELIKETLFIEGSANINQRFLDRRQAISASLVTRTNNRRTVQTYQFSPYLVHAFGSWVTAKLAYNISEIRISSNPKIKLPGIIVGNSLSNQGSLSIKSGRRFSKLKWTLLTQYQTEQRTAKINYKNTIARLDFSYQMTDMLSILGSAGYQNRNSPGSFANFKGFIWDAGFRLVPGPRTSFSFRYGNQFAGGTFSLNAQYKITSKNSINLSYVDTIQTFQSLAFSPGNIVNLDPTQNSSFISSDLTRRKMVNFSVSGTRAKTTYFASAFYSRYKSDNNNLNEKRYGAAFSLQRQLNPRLSISGRFSYNLSKFLSNNINDKFWSASANINYKISKSLVGILGYIHSNRRQARFKNLNGGSNYISLSIKAAL